MDHLFLRLAQARKRLFRCASLMYNSRWSSWLIICLGVVLRLAQYLFNRSLWLDESLLALNITNRSFSELLEPLDYYQGAPVGFLILEKLAIQAFGNNDYVLRLLPFLSGIISLFLFYQVARRLIQPQSVPLALGLFAISGPLIYYSSEVKQYSSDVAIALLLLYAVLDLVQSSNLNASRIALYAVLGAAAIWFSHPATFVLAGAGASLTLLDLSRREWARIRRLSMIYLLWALSLVAFYFVSLRDLCSNDVLLDYWTGAFMPLSLDFSWYIDSFFRLFERAAGLSMSGIAALTFLVGCVSMFSKRKEILFTLISPVILVLLASGFHKYPFAGRFLLFIVPSLLLLIADGAGQIRQKTMHSAAVVGIVLIGLLFLHPSYLASYHLVRPRTKQEVKPVIAYLEEHRQDGDVLYLYHASQYAFKYYAERYGFDDDDYIVGLESYGSDWEDDIGDLDRLRGQGRVWILFSHIDQDKTNCFLTHLDSIGKGLDSFEGTGAAVYLYDLSGEVSVSQIDRFGFACVDQAPGWQHQLKQ